MGGVQSLTLRELSRELGVSHTSPLRHFANKQALLDGLAVRGFERLGAVTELRRQGSRTGFQRQVGQAGTCHSGRFCRILKGLSIVRVVQFGAGVHHFRGRGGRVAPDMLRWGRG